MSFRTLLGRTTRLMRAHPWLIILGTFIVVFSGEIPRLLNLMLTPRRTDWSAIPTLSQILAELRPGIIEPLQRLFQIVGTRFGWAGMVGLIVCLIVVAIVAGVAILVARGGLIAAADQAASTGISNLRAGLRIGWRNAWRLILIASIPPIPITLGAILLVVIATIMVLQSGGGEVMNRPDVQQQLAGPLAVIMLCVLGPLGLTTFILSLFRPLAERACILENCGVIASYRRSRDVVWQHPGEASILALIHISLEAAVGAALLVPQLLASTCAPLIFPIWLVLGGLKAYLMTLWTLAWRDWTPGSAADNPPKIVKSVL